MNTKKTNLIFILFLLLLCCISCAKKNENLILAQPTIAIRHSEKLFVNVKLQADAIEAYKGEEVKLSVGKAVSEIYSYEIVDNLRSSKLFDITDDVSSSDYELEVTILKIRNETQPTAKTILITIVTQWCFKKHNNGELIYQKDILTYEDETVDPGFWGYEYSPMTYIRKVIPKNIQSGTEWLARRTKDLSISQSE